MRQTLSPFVCPHCRNRLAHSKHSEQDLFCYTCHTAVTLVDQTYCYYMVPGTTDKPRLCRRDAINPLIIETRLATDDPGP